MKCFKVKIYFHSPEETLDFSIETDSEAKLMDLLDNYVVEGYKAKVKNEYRVYPPYRIRVVTAKEIPEKRKI